MNIKRILSRTSIKSSLSIGRNPLQVEDNTNDPKDEIHALKNEIIKLKAVLKYKEDALDDLVKDKDNIFLELEKSRKSNKSVYQQLIDKRENHSKEKEYLLHVLNCLSPENNCATIYAELKAKDEVIYNICNKYFKMRENKSNLQRKMDKLKHKNHKICQHIIMLLEKNRETFDTLMNKLTAATITENEQEYLKLLRMNGQFQFENTQLKVSLASIGVERKNSFEEEYCDTRRNINSKTKNMKKISSKNYSKLRNSKHTGSIASDPNKTRLNNKKGKLLCIKNMLKSISEPNIF